jgi:hypothetical protein
VTKQQNGGFDRCHFQAEDGAAQVCMRREEIVEAKRVAGDAEKRIAGLKRKERKLDEVMPAL